MLVGTDGYPIKDEYLNYYIAGGKDEDFKAKAVEFYGVKKQV